MAGYSNAAAYFGGGVYSGGFESSKKLSLEWKSVLYCGGLSSAIFEFLFKCYGIYYLFIIENLNGGN